MQIFVKNIMGKTITIDIDSLEETTETLKAKIELRENIKPEQQRLISGDKQLQDGLTLAQQGLHNHATLHLVVRLIGGR